MTVTLALVFLTLEIDKQLAPAGQWSVPIIYRVIIGSYVILGPNFILTLWANSKDRTRQTGKFVDAILSLKDKCTKILPKNYDASMPLNASQEKIIRRKWDSFELILQSFIFAFQTIALLGTHGKSDKPVKTVFKITLVNFIVLIYNKPFDEIKLQFFSNDEGRQFVFKNGWYFENDLIN